MNLKLTGALELAQRAGVTYKQVDHWTTQGYLKAEARPEGQGNRRAYRPAEVLAAQIIAVLVKAGVSPSVAARAARSAVLEEDKGGPLFMAELVGGVAVTGRIPA